MGRKPKVNKKEKLRALADYREGVRSRKAIANDLNVNIKTLYKWNVLYDAHGEAAFDERATNRPYSRTDKTQAVEAYPDGTCTMRGILKKYKITHSSLLRRWIRQCIMTMRNLRTTTRKGRYT